MWLYEGHQGRTTPNSAHIGIHAKVRVLKLDLNLKRQYFRYEDMKIDELSTFVFVYGVLPSRFRHFPTRRDYMFVKMKNSIVLAFSVL